MEIDTKIVTKAQGTKNSNKTKVQLKLQGKNGC